MTVFSILKEYHLKNIVLTSYFTTQFNEIHKCVVRNIYGFFNCFVNFALKVLIKAEYTQYF